MPGQTRLLLNQESVLAQPFECGSGTACIYARIGPGKQINEDCLAIIDTDANQCIIVVADGVGGGPKGSQASRLAVQAVVDAIQISVPEDSLRPQILDGFELAQAKVTALGIGAATTLVVLEIAGDELRSYHTGDSGCLITGQRGKIKLKTLFHSPTGYGEEAGLLNEQQAMAHEERHIVSNVIGMAGMSVQVGSSIKLAPRDTVIVASDGLFDNATADEIAGDIRVGSIAAAMQRIVDRTTRRMDSPPLAGALGKPDDLAIAMFRLR